MLGCVADGWVIRGLRPPHARTHSCDASLPCPLCARRCARPMSRGILLKPHSPAGRTDLILGLVNGPPPLDISARLAQPTGIVTEESEPAIALVAKEGPQFFRHIAMVDAEAPIGFLLADGAKPFLFRQLLLVGFHDRREAHSLPVGLPAGQLSPLAVARL